MESRKIFILRCHNAQYALNSGFYSRQELTTHGDIVWFDMQQIMRRFTYLPLGITLHVECTNLRSIPLSLPDSKAVIIRTRCSSQKEDFPAALLGLPRLQTLRVSLNVVFKRIPASLQVKYLEASCLEAPYWLAASTCSRDVYVRGYRYWRHWFQRFVTLLVQGLMSPRTCFYKWLTKGLYDPRLLFCIRDFLL